MNGSSVELANLNLNDVNVQVSNGSNKHFEADLNNNQIDGHQSKNHFSNVNAITNGYINNKR